jgi:hypothetical protein
MLRELCRSSARFAKAEPDFSQWDRLPRSRSLRPKSSQVHKLKTSGTRWDDSGGDRTLPVSRSCRRVPTESPLPAGRLDTPLIRRPAFVRRLVVPQARSIGWNIHRCTHRLQATLAQSDVDELLRKLMRDRERIDMLHFIWAHNSFHKRRRLYAGTDAISNLPGDHNGSA